MILRSGTRLLGENCRRSGAKQDRASRKRKPSVPDLEHVDEDTINHHVKKLKTSQQSDQYTEEILQSNARNPGVTCSKALKNFKKFMDVLHKAYAILDPESKETVTGDGCILGPVDGDLNPSVKEFFRAGAIRTMVAWEAFIGDIMAETFDIVADDLWNDPNPKPDLRFETCPPATTSGSLSKWFLHKVLIKNVEDFLSEEDYKARAKKHKEEYLRNIFPLLSFQNEKYPKRGGCVDKTFLQLFYDNPKQLRLVSQKKFQLSSFIPGNSFKYSYTLNDQELNSKVTVTIWIKEHALLRHIIRLYYGLRNVFAHGCSRRTLTTGALSCFPEANDFYSILSDSVFWTDSEKECNEHTKSHHYATIVSKELYCLYEEMCKDATTVRVNYLTLVNLNRFISKLAHFLPRAIEYMVHRDFKVTLWNFDPDMFKRHLLIT